MSGAHLADLAQQAIAGQTAANRARHDIAAGHADPDLLHDRVRAVLATGEPERLRAFCRTLQKWIEGAADATE